MTIKLSQAYESSRRQTYVQEPPRQVRAQCYAAHFQLRDLIISPVPGKLAKANGNSIDGITFPQDSAAASRDKIQTTHLFDLPFAPVCFSYGCGLVALGGQASELSIRTLQPGGQSGWDHANFSLGSNINNSVAIVPRPGSSNLASGEAASPSQARFILSNNDQSIGIWDVHSLYSESSDMTPLEAEALQHEQAPVCPITLRKRALLQPSETAINYCSVSKDGRYMAAVGDTNEVFFYSCPQNANDERGYKLIQTSRASDDATFSADWSRDNATCAVASQDGLVSLFDVRFLRSAQQTSSSTSPPSVVTSFATSKAATASRARGSIGNHYGMSGAARTVKFSPGCTTELLAFTEQSRCFHLVDARSLDPSTHRVCELPRSSSQPPHRAAEDAYWRSLLHPLGSQEPDLSRHARLRVERERDSPTVSLLGATRQRLRRQEEALAAWALEDDERPRPCIDQPNQDAPILDTSNSPDPSEGQSLHTFFYGDPEHDGRQPPWRRGSSSNSAHRPFDNVDMGGPQLQPDGSLTLGPESSSLPSARTLRSSRPDRPTRSESEDAELRASLGLLNMPAWSDVSAHDPFSISGMDWDPHGERLYLATSTTAYEYQVNLCGRNSLPEAVWV